MTMPDDLDLTPDLNPADPQPVEEVTPEAVTSDTPEVEAAPAQPDPWEKINQLADLQRQQLELQMNQQRQAAAPPAPPAWVDPSERPERVAKREELEERAGWDTTALRELLKMDREDIEERMAHKWEQREAAIRQEMHGAQTYQQAKAQVLTSAQQYGDLVDMDTLNGIEAQVLRDVPQHQRALALQDPEFRDLLMDAAIGRRVRTGKQPLPNAPQRPAAPPQVQSSARGTTPPSKATQGMWSDPAYLDSVLTDEYSKLFNQ